MSIASRIESIEGHIEQAYDELQGLGADLTGIDKNIENISMVLDDIYDSMPQVSGEGTSLTLDDTRVGKIKSTLKGNTSQSGTPTPTSPIPVNVVSGDNEINVCGNNLLNLADVSATTTGGITYSISNGVITLNGTSSSDVGINLGNYNFPAGNYAYSDFRTATNNNLYTGLTYSNGWQYAVADHNKKTSTTTGAMTKFRIYVISGTTLNNVQLKPMLVSDTTVPTTYEPYQGNTYNIDLPEGMELCKIGNYQDYFGKSNGRNLYVNDKNTHTFQQNNASWRFIDGTGGASGSDLDTKTIYKARVYNGITYTFSSNITASSSIVSQIVYEDETLIKRIDGATATFNETFTASRDGYVILRLYVGANISVSVSNVMLNEGSTALPYEPYGVGKWYLHREIEELVFNGTENNWAYYTDTSKPVFYYSWGNNEWIYKKNSIWTCFNELYKGQNITATFDNIYNYGNYSIAFRSQYPRLVIRDDRFTTTSDFKDWLSTHNLKIKYVLSIPTFTEITYQPLIDQLNLLEKAMSKDGQTNISQVNNDLPFIISASALKEWQENTSLNSTLSMVNPLSLGNTLNTQEIDNNTQPIEVDNIEPLEEEENEES